MTRRWSRTQVWVCGAATGAFGAFLLDRRSGRRRRALLRDKAARLVHLSSDAAEVTGRNIRDRFAGLLAETRSHLRGSGPASDAVLVDRVRARLGRAVSHPHAIHVEARMGRVGLTGQVLAREVAALLVKLRSIPGVEEIENRLEAHETSEGVPALQGGRPRGGHRPEIMETYWSPALRCPVAAGGAGLMIVGARRGGLAGIAAGVAGAAALLRAATNMEFRRLFGVGVGPHAVSIHKTINIHAPVEEVYQFWSRFENFPRFMSHVKEVRTTADNRSHWKVCGPAGISVEWDAVTTQCEPNRTLAWESIPGSGLETAGSVRLRPNSHRGTQVDVVMCYTPPAGALGHFIASLLGSDPKSSMTEDLVRMKSLIEDGRTSVRGHRVSREELAVLTEPRG